MPNDVEKAQERVIRLREKVAEAAAERDTRLRSLDDDITKAALQAEEDRLQAELDRLNAEKKATAVKEANAGLLEQVKSGGVANVASQDPESDGEPTTPISAARKAGKE